MVNQGVTYGHQGKSDEGLNSYAALIEQFKDSSNEEIQTQVAKAMCYHVDQRRLSGIRSPDNRDLEWARRCWFAGA